MVVQSFKTMLKLAMPVAIVTGPDQVPLTSSNADMTNR
jgi:hypothetical protein